MYALYIVVLLGAWHSLGNMSMESRLLISTPTDTLQYFLRNMGKLGQDCLYTGFESLAGLFLALALTLLLTYSFYASKLLYRIIMPLVLALQLIPLITLSPFLTLAVGISIYSKILMALIVCFLPLVVLTTHGIDRAKASFEGLIYQYSASKWRAYRFVILPATFPVLITALRTSATLSLVGAVVAEFTGAEQGLGKNLFLAAKRLEPELMAVSIILCFGLGLLLHGLLSLVVHAIPSRLTRRRQTTP